MWVGITMWISEWKEVSPRALGAPSFVKLFYYNIYVYTCAHVHTYTHVCVCTHMSMYACNTFFFLTITIKLLSRESTHGVSKVEHSAERMVSARKEMDEVVTVFKLT